MKTTVKAKSATANKFSNPKVVKRGEKPAKSSAAVGKVVLNSMTGAEAQFINMNGRQVPVLNFEPDKQYGVSMGARKIRLVLEHLDEAVAYVNAQGS